MTKPQKTSPQGTPLPENVQIKSRERVRDLGEVYTQPREVDAMLDLVANMFDGIDYRFLEPACGNGNFLVAILERKLQAISEADHGGTECWYEFAVLRCIASIYAIDISLDNVYEARDRMREIVNAGVAFRTGSATPGFDRAVTTILDNNIVLGDSLNGARDIIFVEYTPLSNERFSRQPSYLETPEMDLFYVPPEPLVTVHYSELGSE